MATCQTAAANRLVHAVLRGTKLDSTQLGELCLPSAAFYQEDERATVFRLPELAVPVFTEAISHQATQPPTAVASGFLFRTGKSLKGAAICAVEFEHRNRPADALVLFRLSPSLALLAEEAIEALLRAAPESEAHVYSSPEASEKVKRDKFWAAHYGGVDKKGKRKRPPSSAYKAYRDSIDGVIEAALLRCVPLLRRNCASSAAGDDGGGGGGGELRVAELCGGDGSLAEVLLGGRFGAEMGIASYHLVERNVGLVSVARSKLAPWKEATVERMELTPSARFSLAGPLPGLWLASGSVLNGQVGSAATAESALHAVADALAPGGLLLVTGFTRAFLHPALLHRTGLDEVVMASVPAIDAGAGAFDEPAEDEGEGGGGEGGEGEGGEGEGESGEGKGGEGEGGEGEGGEGEGGEGEGGECEQSGDESRCGGKARGGNGHRSLDHGFGRLQVFVLMKRLATPAGAECDAACQGEGESAGEDGGDGEGEGASRSSCGAESVATRPHKGDGGSFLFAALAGCLPSGPPAGAPAEDTAESIEAQHFFRAVSVAD